MRGRSIRWLALTVGLVGVSWTGCARDEAPEPVAGRARLVAALGGRRALVPRLTGGFSHGPCGDPVRMVCGRASEARDTATAAEIAVLAEIERSGTALERAVSSLLTAPGDPSRLGRAVRALEDLAGDGGDGGDAAALSDLAAAYLVRAHREDHPLDLVRAATAAFSALKLSPELPEARFNLALSLEALSVREGARAAWREYLVVEPSPAWAAEGKRRLRELDGLASAGPRIGRREQRERVLEELLPAWAEHTRRGRADDAARALAEVRGAAADRAIAGAGGEVGDAMIGDLAREIESASPQLRERLARGWSAYGRGVELYRRRELERSARELTVAARALESSPAAAWATVGRALCAYQQGRYGDSLRLLDGVEAVEIDRYPALAGRVWWIRGTIAVLQDRPADGYAAYRHAAAAFDRAGEAESRLAVEVRWVSALKSQGAHETAWRRRIGVLREAPAVSRPQELRVLYTEAADAALATGHPDVALGFLDEALHQLRSVEDPEAAAAVRRWRAAALHQLGRGAEAVRELARARRLLPEIVDAARRTLVEAEIDLLAGELVEASDPVAAVATLTEAIERFRRSSLLNLLPRAYLGRARAHRRLDQEEGAAADVAAAIELIESRRAHAESAADRARFLADVREVYEEAVDLEVRAGRVGRAFERAEALHARVLDDALGYRLDGSPATVLSLDEVRRSLPANGVLLAYLALPDRLLRWSVSRSTVELESVPISAAELDGRVRRLLAAVHSGDEDAVRAAGEVLSAALLGTSAWPVGSLLVVPDGPLHDLPFDLLIDPASGRPLVESVAVAMIPSASVHARIASRDRGRPAPGFASVLVVADPAFSPELLPGLPRLRGARAEGAAVAAVYPRATVLAGEGASPDALLENLGSHPVVHVAAHAVPSAGDPRLSYLALAGGPLYARQIAVRRLETTRVVVLSACASGRSDAGPGEGLAGLSQAFLEAGASVVVGTLWPVDDRAVVPLATAFHQHLVAGADPASALRSAKLERLRAGDPPSVWAAFELIGAAAPEGEDPWIHMSR